MIKKWKQFFIFLYSIWQSIKEAVVNNQDAQQFVKKHALFFGFIKKRLDRNSFWGLPITLIFFAFAYILILFAGIVEDILRADLITSIDTRVENLLIQFRSTELTQFFLWVSLLGYWQTILIFAIIAISILWISRKQLYIAPLLVSIAGAEIFTSLSKIAFHRARPEFAIYVENSFSFPSGHATIAVAFYGFLAYLLFRYCAKWKAKIYIFLGCLTIILLIGFSRLYLGVHYVSDVWGGFLVGSLWLIIGISISEWIYSKAKKDITFFPNKRILLVSLCLLLLSFFFYALIVLNYQPQISQQQTQKKIVVQNVSDIFTSEQLKYTESLTGGKLEPISFIIVTDTDDIFIQAFIDSGWSLADGVGIASLAKTAKDAFFKEEYLNAPMTPSFWSKQTHSFGFEKPTQTNNIRQRHHARFWKTNYITNDGKNIYVGTASLDSGIKWGITHRIDPSLDTERDFLFKDLQDSGTIKNFQKEQFVKPVLGENFSGDQFFTDGKAYVIFFN